MKRWLCVLLTVAMIFCMTTPVFAAESDSSEPVGDVSVTEPVTEPEMEVEKEPEPPTEQETIVTLAIDSKNAYEGMKKAYQKGYSPTVSGKTAVLVLPLMANGLLQDDSVTASLDLGTTENSPFVYKNYEKTFKLTKKKVNGSKRTNSIYYIRFDLALTAQRYNGIYPVVVNLSAHDVAGNAISQSYTTYITIANGKDPNAEGEPMPEPPAEEKPTSSPIVLVTGYSIKPATVMAGSEFSVDVTLFNTSKSKSVQNMTVNASCQSEAFTLKNDSDTIYISKVGINESKTVTLTYQTALNTEPKQYAIDLAMSYDDPNAVTLSSSGTVYVTVKQSQRVELTMPTISKELTAGDTIPLSFQVLNLGRSKVYNVRCDVEGYGLLPTSTAFIGDMEAGTEGNATLNLFVGTKDLSVGYTGTEQYGSTTGTVTLTYEDEEGKEAHEEFSFHTTIVEPVIVKREAEQPQKKPASQWWISVIMVGAVILLTLSGILVYRWRKNNERV